MIRQQPPLTVESIRGAPPTEPLVPVVAPLALDPHGDVPELVADVSPTDVPVTGVPGFVTTGEPLIFGTFWREAALGFPGLTAPGIAFCVAGFVGAPRIASVPPGVRVDEPDGFGLAGATPGGLAVDGALPVPEDPTLPPELPEDPDEPPDEPPL